MNLRSTPKWGVRGRRRGGIKPAAPTFTESCAKPLHYGHHLTYRLRRAAASSSAAPAACATASGLGRASGPPRACCSRYIPIRSSLGSRVRPATAAGRGRCINQCLKVRRPANRASRPSYRSDPQQLIELGNRSSLADRTRLEMPRSHGHPRHAPRSGGGRRFDTADLTICGALCYAVILRSS